MQWEGFVLTGGRSTRMGQDKSLLRFGNVVLLDHIVQIVGNVTSRVHLIGAPHGIPDLYPGIGPVGGILTALMTSVSPWNLVVACDMPGVTTQVLSRLQQAALQTEANCIVPRTPDGREHPLCAAYRRDAIPALERAVRDQVHTLRQAIRLTPHDFLHYSDAAPFQNVNTPQDWAAWLETTHGT